VLADAALLLADAEAAVKQRGLHALHALLAGGAAAADTRAPRRYK
jgi:hypothetical protein